MTDDAYRQLMKHAHRLAMGGHGELAQFLRDALNEATRHRRCPKCGGADVSAATVCHNSKCSEYANELTFYEGWKAPNPTIVRHDDGGGCTAWTPREELE